MTELGPVPARQRESAWRGDADDGSALPQDVSRADMMRRHAQLSLAGRIALFEDLSRDAAWARRAVRVR